MSNIHIRPDWAQDGLLATDESVALNRRTFLAALAAGGVTLTSGIAGTTLAEPPPGPTTRPAGSRPYPAKRNKAFKLDRPITQQDAVLRHINYYEFDASNKPRAVKLAQKLVVDPWTVKITGLVKKPLTLAFEDLEKRFPLEERLYRHRCVETWAMAVPWIGFPLHKLIKRVEPHSSAKFVRFVSFMRPEQAPGQHEGSQYDWPYYEGLRMDEAMNDLTLVTTGLYGRPLSKQNGAPIRIVTPWKYGYKSAKAIVEIRFVDKQPPTFWNTAVPHEYGFYSNVDPAVPHPRWSQAHEWMIDAGRTKKRPTLKYNGYEKLVAGMY